MREYLKDLAKEALNYAEALKVDYSEARVHSESARGVILKNGVVEPPLQAESLGISLRVIVDGALAFSATNVMNRDSVKSLAGEVVKLAKASSSKVEQKVYFDRSKPARKKWAAEEKERIENVSFESMLSVVKNADSALLGSNADLLARFLTFQVSAEEKYYINSEGAECESRIPRVVFHSSLTVKNGSDVIQRFISLGKSGGLELSRQLEIEKKVSDEAVIMKKVLEEGRKAPEGELDVILSPELCGIAAHESIGHPYEADRILGREGAQAGESYLSRESVGITLGSENASVSDDPTIQGSFGYYLVDDEGVEARKRELMKDGRVNELLHNRETANSFGTQSNGSSRASSFDREPIVRMANTYVEPGDYALEELVKEVKHGVYIKSFMEWNIDDRRYNQRYVGLEAYEIVGGEIKWLVRSPVLEITTPRLWGSVKARSKELEFQPAICGKGDPMQGIPVWTGGPNMLLEKIVLGRR
jgi:TldD protein